MIEKKRPRTEAAPLADTSTEPGTSILVAGPAMTGKRGLALSILGEKESSESIFISTNKSATALRREFERKTSCGGSNLRIVDCRGNRYYGSSPADRQTKYVTTAADLTGIGIATSGFMQELYHDSNVEDIHLGLSSLSTLMMFSDVRRVFRFVHALTSRAENVGFRSVFTLDTTARDVEAVGQLKQLFDVVVETRETDEGQELRVRGDATGPRTWTAY